MSEFLSNFALRFFKREIKPEMLDVHQQKIRHKVKRHSRLHTSETASGLTCAYGMETSRAVSDTYEQGKTAYR